MRLLSILGVCCLLSNGVFGVHTGLHRRIYDSFKDAESKVENSYDRPDKLKEILEGIPEITRKNFFYVLQICACSKTRGYQDLYKVCLRKFRTIKRSEIRWCWYYFEEMFCIENTHELNSIAVYYLRTRVEAMILFLERSGGLFVGKHKKSLITKIYRHCISAYDENPSLYSYWHEEKNNGDEWTHALFDKEWD